MVSITWVVLSVDLGNVLTWLVRTDAIVMVTLTKKGIVFKELERRRPVQQAPLNQ